MNPSDRHAIGRRDRYLGFAMLAALITLAFGRLPVVGQAPPVQPPPQYGDANVAMPPYSANAKWPVPATESTAAIQAALDANPKGTVYLPSGTYRLTASLRVRATQSIMGDPVGTNFRQPTILAFSPGIPGIVVEDDSTTGGGQETTISNMVIWGLYKQTTQVAASGIECHAGVRIERCRVTGFKGHGILISAGVPATRANLWQVRDCQLDTNDGDGLHVEGGDANGGLAEEVSATANGGWGIKDDSGLGNTYIACHTRTNVAGAYSIGAGGPGKSGVNASVLVGCYAEADNYRSEFGDMVWWFGGTNATSVRGGQLILPGNAKARFQSSGGIVPPLSVMGSRLLTGPVFSISNWSGGVRAAFSQDGTLSLGLGPGEVVPGQGQDPPPKISMWGDGTQTAIRYAVQKDGYVGPVGDVVAGADGRGYGAGVVTHRSVGAGGKFVDALRLQGGRVEVGQGGLVIPDKPATKAGLKAGAIFYDNGNLVRWDGQNFVTLGGR